MGLAVSSLLTVPFSSAGDGDAARFWAYPNARCLPPLCLALLGLVWPGRPQSVVCGTHASQQWEGDINE